MSESPRASSQLALGRACRCAPGTVIGAAGERIKNAVQGAGWQNAYHPRIIASAAPCMALGATSKVLQGG